MLIVFTILIASTTAHAFSICEYYRKNVPSLYKSVCKSGSRKTRPAGANSTFSGGFNMNAAALPTEPSSYGLETIASYIRGPEGRWSPNFALVKGFKKIGTGVSTSGNNTFYGNDVVQRVRSTSNLTTFSPLERAEGKLTNLNIGTSFRLITLKKQGSLSLGLSGRYNKTTDTIGGGPGLAWNSDFYTIGFGTTYEKISNEYDRILFVSSILSVKFLFFEIEYDFLKNAGGPALSPIHIATFTASYGRLIASGAIRYLNYRSENFVWQRHFGIQVLLNKHFSLGYLHNYMPGTNSVAFQFYL